MGHAITGGGFYNIDVEPLKGGKRAGEVFAAVIKFLSAPLSEEQLAAELKHLVDDMWDWQVRRLSESEFSVIFPTRQTLRLSTGSGKLYLPLNKNDTEIREAFNAPKPYLVLPSTWVRLTGVPEDLMERERLMVAFGMVGRAIDVDDLSILKRETEPIRIRFQCRYPERIKGSVQVFVNGEGFTVGVQAERGPRDGIGGGAGDPPPSPAHDDRDEKDSEFVCSDGERNKNGRKEKKKDKYQRSDLGLGAGAVEGAGASGAKTVGAELLGSWSAPARGQWHGGSVAWGFNQYGSNLGVDMGPLPMMLDKAHQGKMKELELLALKAGAVVPELRAGAPSGSADSISQVTDPLPSWVADS
jgi:hypothetical protein